MNRRLDQLEQVAVASADELRTWLAANHARSTSVWLVTEKKRPGSRYVPYGAIVEQLLCFGWIDSVPRARDAARTMVLISPRKPGSNWSKDNRERIERLERSGQMTPTGIRAVEAARRDGSWDRLVATEGGAAPPDLAQALAAAKATEGWDSLSLSVRRRSLEFLLAAKRPETRARRIAQIVDAAAQAADPTMWKPKR